MMIRIDDKEKIKEFLELSDKIYMLRKFHKPVLVYDIKDDKVRYSLWEAEVIDRFGLKNVDGWDYQESIFYCPDWMQNPNEEDEEDDDIDDFDDDL